MLIRDPDNRMNPTFEGNWAFGHARGSHQLGWGLLDVADLKFIVPSFERGGVHVESLIVGGHVPDKLICLDTVDYSVLGTALVDGLMADKSAEAHC